jgi:N4-(beta-N-acetylglucosaminyl)-L-asparaginase
MASNRRKFLKKSALLGGSMIIAKYAASRIPKPSAASVKKTKKSIFISTWNHGKAANAKAIEVVNAGGSALDGVEQGAMLVESDPKVSSVGLGGWPDRDGHVTLDACIMNFEGDAGSVCFLEGFEHPISVARKVMEETPHVILAGAGAAQFAKEQGFEEKNLLTIDAADAWLKWKKKSNYEPTINIENHDTIGMVGIHNGELAGACTTSGLAFKMHGRVGDSPIIGAGLYVDGEIGACSATGLGEYILKVQCSFLVVEFMRQGKSPAEAVKAALERIVDKFWKNRAHDFQVGLVAINTNGDFAGYSILPGYSFAVNVEGESQIFEAPFLIEK